MRKKVIVVGGGVAGVTAAVELASIGMEPMLFESTPALGGRLYSFNDKQTGEIIDNGQHIMMGAYTNFLALLDKLGTYDQLYIQQFLEVFFTGPEGWKTSLNTSHFPGRPGMIAGLLGMGRISVKSKFQLIRFAALVLFDRVKVSGVDCYELLKRYKQGDDIIERFWEPMILAVLNLKPAEAEASLLIEVLKRAFLGDTSDARIMIPKKGIGELLGPAADFIKDNGGEVHLSETVKELLIENRVFKGIKTDKATYHADALILACPPESLKRLMFNHFPKTYFKILSSFEYSPITSIYFWTDMDFMEEEFSALLGTNIQWIFNRRKLCNSSDELISKYPGHYTVTISASDEISEMNDEAIGELFWKEINMLYPESRNTELLHYTVVNYKRATIRITPDIVYYRFNTESSIPNMFFAGDWTNTSLPATIEGAALSGIKAAEKVLLI